MAWLHSPGTATWDVRYSTEDRAISRSIQLGAKYNMLPLIRKVEDGWEVYCPWTDEIKRKLAHEAHAIACRCEDCSS